MLNIFQILSYNLLGDNMNFNLAYILQNGMRILNIVNRTLPLVREFNPAMSFITKKIKDINTNIQNNTSNTPLNNILKTNAKSKNNNSNLTFFR